jgi:hypothetical protein
VLVKLARIAAVRPPRGLPTNHDSDWKAGKFPKLREKLLGWKERAATLDSAAFCK